MKKILIGICGFGNGHTVRQTTLVSNLMQRGHHIVLTGEKHSLKMMRQYFPHLPMVEIHIPWVTCGPQGIDFADTKRRYKRAGVDWYNTFLAACIAFEEAFSGKPDIVISDYEPNCAQYAYAVGCTFITIDQQSKFLALAHETLHGYSAMEELSRLLYFFPKADRRIVTSFYPFKHADSHYALDVYPPIIKPTLRRGLKEDNAALIYFSPFPGGDEWQNTILGLAQQLPHIQFEVYSKTGTGYADVKNLHMHAYDETFDHSLMKAQFVISSAGHQLISECLYLDTPMLVYPLNTFDQHYCTKMLEDYEIGCCMAENSLLELKAFIGKQSKFVGNIRQFKSQYWNAADSRHLLQTLQNLYGL